MHPRTGRADPRWHSGSAAIGGALVAKFAWSQIAARRTHQESQVLMALRAAAPLLQLPEVIATGTDPVLLVTRLVPGRPLTAGGIAALDRAGVHYRQASGRDLDLERVLAWHLRTVLGDALWRSEAGVALPGGGDPPRWVDELALRLNDAGVTAA